MNWKILVDFLTKILALMAASVLSLIILHFFGILEPMTDLSIFCARKIFNLFGLP